MSEFDDFDEFDDLDLGHRLRAAAGGEPDLAGAHQSVRRRVVRARRRRAAAVSGAAAVLVATLGIVAVVRNGPEHRIQTAAPDTVPTADSTSTSAATSSTTDASTTTTDPLGPATTTPPTTPLPTAPTVTSPPITPTPTTLAGRLPNDPVTSSTLPTSTSVPDDNEPSSSAAPATDETRSFPSLGGSITVQLSNGQLHLLDVAPAAGYTLDHQDVNSDDIQVRFRSGDLESRIRVRIVGGQMQGTTEER